MPNSFYGVIHQMGYDVLGVYLVDFKNNQGGELSGKHYAVLLNGISNDDTFLVVTITIKKTGKKYRGGFTIVCTKYKKNPTYDKAFVKVIKIREIHKSRIYGKKIYDLDDEDIGKLKESFFKIFKFLI